MESLSNVAVANSWNERTDDTWLMANALEWTIRGAPCPADLNRDALVNDAELVIFVVAYNELICGWRSPFAPCAHASMPGTDH